MYARIWFALAGGWVAALLRYLGFTSSVLFVHLGLRLGLQRPRRSGV